MPRNLIMNQAVLAVHLHQLKLPCQAPLAISSRALLLILILCLQFFVDSLCIVQLVGRSEGVVLHCKVLLVCSLTLRNIGHSMKDQQVLKLNLHHIL